MAAEWYLDSSKYSPDWYLNSSKYAPDWYLRSSSPGSPQYFTSDGSDLIDLGSQLVPGSGDWKVELNVLIPSLPAVNTGFIGQADAGWASTFLTYYNAPGDWRVVYGGYLTNYVSINMPMSVWFPFSIRKVGTSIYASVNGGNTEVSGTCAATISITNALQLCSNRFNAQKMACRVSNLRVTSGGVTKTFPLNDGPGVSGTNRDIKWYDSLGGVGVITDAVQGGTVSLQWANKF